jgi:hypothetical protein
MMAVKRSALSSAILICSLGAAAAGPCNTASQDAGSGKVPGYTGQTTGKASEKEHPPTASMNKAAGNTATSSQDTNRQTQGQPTAAEQADSSKAKDQGC